MKFPYSSVFDVSRTRPVETLLPWLPVELSPNESFKNSLTPLGLLDSGADVSIVTRRIGEDLGIAIESGVKTIITGVGGGQITGYIHVLNHRIFSPMLHEPPIIFRGEIVFSEYEFPKSMPQSTAIWGRMCVFRETIVTFDDPDNFEVTR